MLKRRFKASVVITRKNVGQLVHSEATVSNLSARHLPGNADRTRVKQRSAPSLAFPAELLCDPVALTLGETVPPASTFVTQLRAWGSARFLQSKSLSDDLPDTYFSPFNICIFLRSE